MSGERTLAFLVMRLRSWADFEPAPGSWAPFPVGIKGEGLGFLVVYATMEEALEASDDGKYQVLPVRLPNDVIEALKGEKQ